MFMDNATGPSDGPGTEQAQTQAMVPAPIPRPRYFFDTDLEKMHTKLYYERYLPPKEFLEDVSKMVANAEIDSHRQRTVLQGSGYVPLHKC